MLNKSAPKSYTENREVGKVKCPRFSVKTFILVAAVSFTAYAGAAEQNEPNKWFMYWGAANIHPGLRESEARIDRELNDTLGKLIPGWKRPITLKDWSDSFLLWDGHVGIGRDLSPKWSWFAGTGGAAGTVKNNERYLLPVPLRVRMDFSRRAFFLVTGLDYYAWGKPGLRRESAPNKLLKSIRATRPFAEIAIGYTRLKTIADVTVELFGGLSLLKEYEEKDYDLFHISPRIGLETPLGKNDSIRVQAGYLFFNQHPDEFNSFCIYMFHKHKF